MQGGVNYNGNTLLSGGINVNTTGNIQALNVQVTENGERTITPPEGVDGYAPITIDTNVPIPEPVLDTLNVTSNGTYTPPSGVDGYDKVNVSVPTPEPVLDTLNVTSNGTYTPPSGVDGYDEVNVSVSGYTIKTLSTTPTPIASFTDGTDNPLKSLTASIVPVQSGSGDPSPTNVRPISGWTEANVTRCGKNLFSYNNGFYNIYYIYNTPTGDGSFVTLQNAGGWKSVKIKVKGLSKITISGFMSQGGVSGAWLGSDNFNDVISTFSSVDNNGTKQVPSGAKYVVLGVYNINTNYETYPNAQIEVGDTATEYEPYNGNTTTIPFTDSQGQSVTVYGGEIDVINGVVTPCPYYASYNGEQLTGEWISDRDVYAEGTTPTIGAQVVNIGATGTPFHTQPTSIKSLEGVNNVSASTGDVEELKYFANL